MWFCLGRDVAQSGSAPEWGSGGREFESPRPDHWLQLVLAHPTENVGHETRLLGLYPTVSRAS